MNDGRFDIKNKLGQGSFGITYLAYDNFLQKFVALKIVTLKTGVEEENAINEIEALKYLSRESNKYIVSYYDSFVETQNGEKKLIIVTEYITGITLAVYIKNIVSLTVETLLSLMYGLVAGLKYIHHNNYAHGDIKLDNIMVTDKGEIKYIDFGLSCVKQCIRPNCTNLCSIKRSSVIHYASPDYYRSNYRDVRISQSNDVWGWE